MLKNFLNTFSKSSNNKNSNNKNSNMNLKAIKDIIKVLPAPQIDTFFNNLLAAYQEKQKTDLEMEKINLKKEIVLKEIEEKYDLYNKIFCEIFAERRLAINKSFEIIDKGILENDKELINMGLSSLSKVVASSPFSSLDSLSKLLEENNTIEI